MNPLPCLCTPQKRLMASTNFFPCCSTQKKKPNDQKKNEIGLFIPRPGRPWRFLAFFTRFFQKIPIFSLSKKSRVFQKKKSPGLKTRDFSDFCRLNGDFFF
jgi:hypothetical protein